MRFRMIIPVLAVAALAAFALHAPASAQTAPRVGAVVKDVKGVVIGPVERVINGPDGKPRQVLIRGGRVLRPLPVDGLVLQDGAYVTPLTKAEFEILQASE